MTHERDLVPEEFSGRLSEGKDWKEIVAWVGDLPPLPHIAAQALGLIEDPDTTAGKLAALLGGDTALAARVLKIANSAMFSRQREITTINQAIMIIGFKTLKGIIVAATLRQLNRKFGAIEKMIWENSTCTAVASRYLATQMRKSYTEEVFLLGLLHDLGKLVLMRQIPDDYKNVFQTALDEGAEYVDVEQELLGYSHPLIGALVAKKWNFSMDTCKVILHHHDDIPYPFEDQLQERTALVKLADTVSHALGYGHEEGYLSLREESLELAAQFGLSEQALDDATAKIGELFTETGAVFM